MGNSKARIDMTGETHGNLKVLRYSGTKKIGKARKALWECECQLCGRLTSVTRGDLLNVPHISCGCRLHASRKALPEKLKPYRIDGTNVAIIRNEQPNKNSQSGIRGVCWCNTRQKWRASIVFQRKSESHYFGNLEDAVKCRKEMEGRYFAPVIERAKC